MSYTQIYYHVIFSTKNRERTLPVFMHTDLYDYIWGILKNKNCTLYRINGTEDHIHICFSLRPSLSLSDVIRDIKRSAAGWIKKMHPDIGFLGWQTEYAAFTKSHADKETVITYVSNQKEHHKTTSFIDELKSLLDEHGVSYNDAHLH